MHHFVRGASARAQGFGFGRPDRARKDLGAGEAQWRAGAPTLHALRDTAAAPARLPSRQPTPLLSHRLALQAG